MHGPSRLALVLLSFLLSSSALAQTEEGRPRRPAAPVFEPHPGGRGGPGGPKWIHYPVVAYSPETSWEIGVSSLLVYSANRDLSNRLSELKAFTFYTLENQYGLWLDHTVYTDQNEWFIYGRARYQASRCTTTASAATPRRKCRA